MRNNIKFCIIVLVILLASSIVLTGCMYVIVAAKNGVAKVYDMGSRISADINIIVGDDTPTSQTELQKKFSSMYDISEDGKTISVISKEYLSEFWHSNYEKEVIQLQGLPRYDNLKNVEDKHEIIIMPSWRRYLTRKSNEYIAESEYFKRFNSLINNEKLIEKAREHNYEIIFRPHPNVYNFIELFDENDYVKIDYEKTKFQTLFNNGSLLITDYSSVAFDFAYLYKPVIYYQYGKDYHFDTEKSFFDYESMGMGEICKNEDELVDLIIGYIENNCKIKNKYVKRIDGFFLFNDKNNCKRVHEAIHEVPLKD